MQRCEPNEYYRDFPCSVIAICCGLKGYSNELDSLYAEAKQNDNYASLQRVNREIKKLLKVKQYTYYTREQRIPFKMYHGKGRAIVCVYGHYIYVDFDKNCYWSFFDNLNDKVVAVWELV